MAEHLRQLPLRRPHPRRGPHQAGLQAPKGGGGGSCEGSAGTSQTHHGRCSLRGAYSSQPAGEKTEENNERSLYWRKTNQVWIKPVVWILKFILWRTIWKAEMTIRLLSRSTTRTKVMYYLWTSLTKNFYLVVLSCRNFNDLLDFDPQMTTDCSCSFRKM